MLRFPLVWRWRLRPGRRSARDTFPVFSFPQTALARFVLPLSAPPDASRLTLLQFHNWNPNKSYVTRRFSLIIMILFSITVLYPSRVVESKEHARKPRRQQTRQQTASRGTVLRTEQVYLRAPRFHTKHNATREERRERRACKTSRKTPREPKTTRREKTSFYGRN